MEPIINKDGNKWKYTCSKCSFVPDKEPIFTSLDGSVWDCVWNWPEPDYVRTMKISKRTGEKGFSPLHLPDRCNECKRRYRRATRMRKRIRRIMEYAESESEGYKIPKLLTFALPAERSDSFQDRVRLIRKLDSKLPRARQVLQDHQVKGGVYVIECTSRLVPLNDGGHLFQWKHHPHVHMVAIARYQKDIKKFCEILMPLGLGRINYKATRQKNKIAEYISKYLIKDKQISRRFGIFHGNKNRPPS